MSESRKFDYYENVTQNAVSNMNAFQVKDSNWTVSVPVNGATGLSYTPDSRILLMLKQQGAQDKDPRFFTFNQINELGYMLERGAKSTTAVAVKTRDENGNFIPFAQQPKHFESVFHASDVKQRIYKTDAQGNKIPYLDRDGNSRFSRDGRQLYQYEIKPLTPFEGAKKWQVDISCERAEAIFNATEKLAEIREQYTDDTVCKAISTFSKMMLAAETSIRLIDNKLDIKELSQLFSANHKLFTECVRQASQLTKAFKEDLKKELARQKENEEISFMPIDEKPVGKMLENRTDIGNTTDLRMESIAEDTSKTDNFLNTIGNNIVEICIASMKANGMNEREMFAVLDAIKDRGVELVKSKDEMHSVDFGKNR